jgi:dimethylhistidine N-methyltransferase
MSTTLFAADPVRVVSDPQFAADVLAGFSDPTQKWLHAKYLYDAVGSALFEAITALPEYGLTRADSRLLQRHAKTIAGYADGPVRVIELGSGSGVKTRWILEAAVAAYDSISYAPIDVSAAALEICSAALEGIPGVTLEPEHATYIEGLRAALKKRRFGKPALVLFLGSSIGNFSPPDALELLTDVYRELSPGDALLLGADLVKPERTLVEAYDDPAGVTAAFNRNLLGRMNRELGADFDLRAFTHEARFDADASRVEMHLRAAFPQTVYFGALEKSFHFAAGETLWTESSYKFTAQSVRDLGRQAGFYCSSQWTDVEWPFAETLFGV